MDGAAAPATTQAATPDTGALAHSLDETRKRIQAEVGKVVVGLAGEVDLFLAAIVARGHILFEGVPGVAKTLLAKTVATAVGCDFRRIQFTPDLLPGDITGTFVFDRNRSEFIFRKGPIFTQILLADEINRAPAKTQSALLEAMQERQVTIEGNTSTLDDPFMVIATQNPIEQEGVYRLPEAQLDRFFLRVVFGHPAQKEEIDILRMHGRDVPDASAVTSPRELLAWRHQLQFVDARAELYEYITALARESRKHKDVFLGISPRGSLSVLKAAQAWAFLHGRPYVTHDDVKRMVGPVLNHRLILRPEAEIAGRRAEDVLREILDRLPAVKS
ncbi:MAG: MoxR family ATPase [Planctomycetes bacterium]|nr:MoxR family ATPase [Planctomycetota bacterium]